MNTKIRILIAASVEIAYAVFTRLWLSGQLSGVELELAVSAARLATAIVYWFLFRRLIQSRKASFASIDRRLLVLGLAIALAVPMLFRGWSPGGGFGTAMVFAATSLVVGLREELLYRAVLLNLLQPRIGSIAALAVSTGLFVIYHLGAQAMTPLWLVECIALSLMLGAIYLRTASLACVVVFHSLYDAAWFFGPFVAAPLEDRWRPAFLLAALIITLWSLRGRVAQ